MSTNTRYEYTSSLTYIRLSPLDEAEAGAIVEPCSTNVDLIPCSANEKAVAVPATPPPMIKVSVLLELSSIQVSKSLPTGNPSLSGMTFDKFELTCCG